MVTSTLQSDKKSDRRAISRSLGYDFALLGLNARESRVEIIRKAAHRTAERIHDAAVDEQEQNSMLSDLATSTYRLLDPRRRQKMLERVQLCILSEDDLELQKGSRVKLVPQGVSRGESNLSTVTAPNSGRAKKASGGTFEKEGDERRVGASALSLLAALSAAVLGLLGVLA